MSDSSVHCLSVKCENVILSLSLRHSNTNVSATSRYGNTEYLLSTEYYNYEDAKSYCLQNDMTLVSVHSQDEWERVLAFAGDVAECGSNCGFAGQNRDCHWFWLGAQYSAGQWVWSDGTEFDFTPSFFEDMSPSENHLAAWGQPTATCYNKGNGWHDAHGSWEMQALCQRYHDPDEALCFAGQYVSTNLCLEKCFSDPTIPHLNSTASLCENTDSDDTCAFVCDEGYYATDVASCYNGTFLDGPLCAELPCSEIDGVEFMSDETQCNGTASGESCNLVCMDGYTARPSSDVSCYLGQWMNLPICEEDSCFGTPVLTFGNATASDCGNVSLPGSVCVNVCRELYSPVGNWTCSRGEWSPQDPDYCEPGCDTYPRRVPYMDIPATRANCQLGTPLGGTCDLVCLPGYEPSGSVQCGRGGRWYVPYCVEQKCYIDPDIDNIDGNASLCENTESRSSCAFTCQD